MTSLSAKEFQQITGVSDDVLVRLQAYADLLEKWQAKINLVGASTMPDLWRRHMLDSAQLHGHLSAAATIVDLGSGAGFPGLVLAAMGAEHVHLIESDARKCAFLAEAARIMGLTATVTVHNERIEAVETVTAPLEANVVTARALASLDDLLGYAQPFLKPSTICLFLKGKTADDELTVAANSWKMTTVEIPSLSDPSGTILKLEAVARRDD